MSLSSRDLLAAFALASAACAGSASPVPHRQASARTEIPQSRAPLAAATAEPLPEDRSAAASDAGSDAVDASIPDSSVPPDREQRPRLTSLAFITWIWPHPKASGRFIGLMRLGQSVALRSADLTAGEGCSGGFFAIEPRGYVCQNRAVTLTPSARFAAVAHAIEEKPGPLPFGYALSNGAPMYNRLPTRAEQTRSERILGPATVFRPLVKALAAHQDLATTERVPPDGTAPSFVTDGDPLIEGRRDLVNQMIPLGSMLSWSAAYDIDGRTFLLSTDMTLVPADRVRPYRVSAFHGTKLGGDVALPIAWARATARAKWRQTGTSSFERTEDAWPVRSFVRLTGTESAEGTPHWLETMDEDAAHASKKLWILESDATVVKAAEKIPFSVKPTQKWIVVRITQGTLVAYEGLTPVYATLVSPGAGGLPNDGQDPVKSATTPLGTYRVTFKDRAATMSPDKDPENRTFWIADVPNTQYFNPPFALHAAYWHERFGEPTSAGCINLSPVDAEALFDWSDPRVPEGWSGATGAGAIENGATTAVIVRR